MFKSRHNLIIIFTAAFAVSLFFSCSFNNKNKISASGNIEIIETNISSKNNETVKKLYVEEGDTVKKGEPIAELNHTILDLQLRQAKSNFENAEVNYKRILDIYKSGNISQKDRDDAQNLYVSTKSTYEITKQQIEDCSLKSPVDGVVTHKLVQLGEYVNVGTPIYTVSQVDPVDLTIYVTELELGKVKIGQEAKISIDSYPNRTFTGKVIYISPNAEFTPKNIQTKDERIKQVYGVKIEIPNKDGILKPGMPADAVIQY